MIHVFAISYPTLSNDSTAVQIQIKFNFNLSGVHFLLQGKSEMPANDYAQAMEQFYRSLSTPELELLVRATWDVLPDEHIEELLGRPSPRPLPYLRLRCLKKGISFLLKKFKGLRNPYKS